LEALSTLQGSWSINDGAYSLTESLQITCVSTRLRGVAVHARLLSPEFLTRKHGAAPTFQSNFQYHDQPTISRYWAGAIGCMWDIILFPAPQRGEVRESGSFESIACSGSGKKAPLSLIHGSAPRRKFPFAFSMVGNRKITPQKKNNAKSWMSRA